MVLYAVGMIAAFVIGIIISALILNEIQEEQLRELTARLESLKKRCGMYPDKTGQKWLTWEERRDEDATD